MATARMTPAQSAADPGRVRQRRRRDEELLVWPDLVFIEFICAVLFTILLTVLAVLVDAVLLDQANGGVTPNPSKAPWYFLNLQELLLHMHPALAGVVVPTVALIALGAIPYFDNSNEGQGEWLKTPHAWPNVAVGALTGAIGTTLLILFDASKHVQIYQMIRNGSTPEFLPDGKPNAAYILWPSQLNWTRSLRALQTEVNWPDWSKHVPIGKVFRTDLLGFPKWGLNLNLPAILVEQAIPTTIMIGLPLLLSFVAAKTGLAKTRRDHMILLFSGFIATYVTLTIIGTYFRAESQTLAPYSIFASTE